MLHILLLVLKIIGIIIAAILGILVLLLCIVLFVCVCIEKAKNKSELNRNFSDLVLIFNCFVLVMCHSLGAHLKVR